MLSRIGMRIQQRRLTLGLTQTELARRLSIGPANIHRIEHGKQNLTIDTLCRLAEALGTTVAELVTGQPPPADAP
ncbi:MAG: helix-turn-helix transcriptional regulator [Minicystis sp.]